MNHVTPCYRLAMLRTLGVLRPLAESLPISSERRQAPHRGRTCGRHDTRPVSCYFAIIGRRIILQDPSVFLWQVTLERLLVDGTQCLTPYCSGGTWPAQPFVTAVWSATKFAPILYTAAGKLQKSLLRPMIQTTGNFIQRGCCGGRAVIPRRR